MIDIDSRSNIAFNESLNKWLLSVTEQVRYLCFSFFHAVQNILSVIAYLQFKANVSITFQLLMLSNVDVCIYFIDRSNTM